MYDDKKRNFVRVDSELMFSVKKIEAIPEIWLRTSSVYLTKTALDIPVHKESIENEEMFRLIYSALGQITDELRTIKERLGIEDALLYKKELNISGGGISFFDEREFAKDSIVECSIVLPLELPMMVKAVAKIVGESVYHPEKKAFFYQANFVLIDNDDRELIIRYTFKRQRELINQGKNK